MDLIGHDTNFAVTSSVFEANFFDKRYVPSLMPREMVDGGLLGRKSGQGFYRYPEGAPPPPVPAHEVASCRVDVTVHGEGPIADWLEAGARQALASHPHGPARLRKSDWVGLQVDQARLELSTGETAAALAARIGVENVAVFDRTMVLPLPPGSSLAYAVAARASESWRRQAPAWLAAMGVVPQAVADTPGLVVARTIAMLINEAADAVLQGVCTPEGADAAMKLGVNYPTGPFEWLARWSVPGVVTLLEALDAAYRGERYRVSPWLRRQS
jgi:3-hydroxybutyryl-CoA dehydrogenase